MQGKSVRRACVRVGHQLRIQLAARIGGHRWSPKRLESNGGEAFHVPAVGWRGRWRRRQGEGALRSRCRATLDGAYARAVIRPYTWGTARMRAQVTNIGSRAADIGRREGLGFWKGARIAARSGAAGWGWSAVALAMQVWESVVMLVATAVGAGGASGEAYRSARPGRSRAAWRMWRMTISREAWV